MSRADNADWGTTFETEATETLDLEDVTDAGDDEGFRHVDAIATRSVRSQGVTDKQQPALYYADRLGPGDRIACKVARYRVSDGSSTRRGRYWITRAEHEAVDGYAMGVYHPDVGVLEDAVVVLPQKDVEKLIGTWTACRAWDRADEAARISWGRVFDPQEVSLDG